MIEYLPAFLAMSLQLPFTYLVMQRTSLSSSSGDHNPFLIDDF
jgi:hypothetical protein